VTNTGLINRYTITFAIICIIIIVAAAIAGGGSSSMSRGKTYVCTVDADAGLSQLKITNVDEVASITLTTADLPFSFNYTSNDQLSFNVTAVEGYVFDAWWFSNDGTFDHHNPLTIKGKTRLSMTATFLPLDDR
jgi:hypothetical protein